MNILHINKICAGNLDACIKKFDITNYLIYKGNYRDIYHTLFQQYAHRENYLNDYKILLYHIIHSKSEERKKMMKHISSVELHKNM